jgi:hypothetical protein
MFVCRCKKFRELRERCLMEVTKNCLSRWKQYVENFTSVRATVMVTNTSSSSGILGLLLASTIGQELPHVFHMHLHEKMYSVAGPVKVSTEVLNSPTVLQRMVNFNAAMKRRLSVLWGDNRKKLHPIHQFDES